MEQREGRFNLEVMGSNPAANRLLIELPALSSDKLLMASLQRLPSDDF
jgi:hypothetical protein